MKKIILSILSVMILALSAKADEGMWLLPLLQKMNIKTMKKMGLKLSAEEIYSVNKSSLKDAIVQFGGGCTGEMISDEGLLITNHHCGYSYIQQLSSDEHNYLENGYWAMNRSEEIPAPGLTVTFLQRMDDVTQKINSKKEELAKSYSGKDLNLHVTKYIDGLVKEAQEANPNCKVEIEDFYNKNVFYLIIYKVYKDVRFVGAPPSSVGKFGGDTDNWMWPRHTGDFSMFRVYANADNEPAEYSVDNVPFRPKKSLAISLKDVKQGDFTMTIGYPGSTERFQTAEQFKSMLASNAIRIKARTIALDIMKSYMSKDPSVRLKYADKAAHLSNGWKKWQGMELAFDKLSVIDKQLEKEKDLLDWIAQSEERVEKYGNPIDSIKKVSEEMSKTYNDLITINSSLVMFPVLSSVMKPLVSLKDTTMAAEVLYNALLPLYKDYYEPLERDLSKAILSFYVKNLDKNYSAFLGEDLSDAFISDYVDSLYNTSLFANKESFENIKGKTLYQIVQDPMFMLYVNVSGLYRNLIVDYRTYLSRLQNASIKYGAAKLAYNEGKATYPDANFTMRLSFGTVQPYSPKDGVDFRFYTTLKGVMEKEDPSNYEFIVPAKLKELYKNKDFGAYESKSGDLRTCFLTTNDITGGNSGSPVLDAKGNLIALAFDGNWESMSSDVMFEPDLQRCICVDIHYVLFLIDKVGGAAYLLDEMKIVR